MIILFFGKICETVQNEQEWCLQTSVPVSVMLGGSPETLLLSLKAGPFPSTYALNHLIIM